MEGEAKDAGRRAGMTQPPIPRVKSRYEDAWKQKAVARKGVDWWEKRRDGSERRANQKIGWPYVAELR